MSEWMPAGMLDQPHVPLASVEKWLSETEHRYRLAGHSERAVRGAEFSVAAHIGDVRRAERAYAAWLAADRDSMADRPACEPHGQGRWQAGTGRARGGGAPAEGPGGTGTGGTGTGARSGAGAGAGTGGRPDPRGAAGPAGGHSTPMSSRAPCRPPWYATVSTAR
ncbi:predicted protein [Streptomyces viridosporus ATCC 14672]|uniref:Predicted protein n=1 Tax=Streptomyces viridosporus (strain ATCC 14672 / DSM 40746 / JCM 4963 / KCTC 9882 / NRRL B-12104 / FH 1290) TaxID=566461 RepID=D5ZUM3_STRV1|nr:predicted protein [Streptomyces viridosporus ATCC 14672]